MQVDGDSENAEEVKRVLSRFKSDSGEVLPGGLLDLPVNVTVDKLQLIVNALLQQEDPVPLAFFINDVQITESLEENIKEFNTSEDVVEIVYQPQAIFQVRAVTRCTGTLEGMQQFFNNIIYPRNKSGIF